MRTTGIILLTGITAGWSFIAYGRLIYETWLPATTLTIVIGVPTVLMIII